MRNALLHTALTIPAFAGVVTFAPAAVAAGNYKTSNDIQYTDDMWTEEFVGIAKEKPIYLPEDLIIDITDSPANDSPETAEDLDFLFWLEKNTG